MCAIGPYAAHLANQFCLPCRNRHGKLVRINAYIAMFDLCKPEAPISGSYIWLPLQFHSGKPTIQWHTECKLELFSEP